jgi:hypothetical protein
MPKGISSAIRDNQGRGKVGDLLKEKIQQGSKLSIVSAYFTIYAYDQLKEKLSRPTTNKDGKKNRKILVFTAFADTAAYLYSSIKDWALKKLKVHLALVSGGSTENKTTFGKNDYSHILTNFSPVRFNFTHAKQILEIFRMLAANNTKAFEKLCDIFNAETAYGSNMDKYDELLEKAVNEITRTFRKRAVGALLSGRGGKLPPQAQQVKSAEDFELITWLIIQGEC